MQLSLDNSASVNRLVACPAIDFHSFVVAGAEEYAVAEGVGPVFRVFAHVQQTGEGLVSPGSEMFREVEKDGSLTE